MHALETYLRELRDIRSTGAGVKETSYYPALSNLFNELGKTLSPRVRCIITLAAYQWCHSDDQHRVSPLPGDQED